MNSDNLSQLSQELIDKDKWADVLRRFVDVLRINVFIVDNAGRVIIPPVYDRDNRGIYGARYLNLAFNFDLNAAEPDILNNFKPHGLYLEARGLFDLYSFGVPIKIEKDNIIGCVIVGPVILNRRWDMDAYLQAAKEMNLAIDDFADVMHEIRVVSFVTIKAVFGLVAQVVKNITDLRLENIKLHQKRFKKDVLPGNILADVKDMYASIHLDELLVTVLDVALNITGAERGSIMLVDKEKGELNIQVARGIDKEKIMNTKVKLGEGIAGIVAQENRSFVISGMQAEERIKPFLTRPEIKQSAVVPLAVQNRVFGVLNLHTEQAEGKIEIDEKNLQHISRLISTALYSI
jgi:hypothetical protein